ncbi:hypothetical protein C4K02_0536 [Pseudomonas synxantha]|nr:hypothetical protein C4K02_0536 [Pseudomonas synxantha]
MSEGFFVGASLLAKNVNDYACFLNKRGACEFFASKLAPTEGSPLPHLASSGRKRPQTLC